MIIQLTLILRKAQPLFQIQCIRVYIYVIVYVSQKLIVNINIVYEACPLVTFTCPNNSSYYSEDKTSNNCTHSKCSKHL